MGREYRIQAALKEPFGLVADMVALCQDDAVIGSDFYVMQRVDGIIPRRDLPPEVDLDEAAVRRLCTGALDVLIQLHRIDPDSSAASARSERAPATCGGRSRAGRRGSATRAPRTSVDYEGASVMAWLDEHQPDDVANCVIHNDFRFDNLVLDRDDPTRVVGVLDWEMATLGDPLMDLGGTLAYWVQDDDDEFFRQFRRQPTHLPGMLSRDEVVRLLLRRDGLRGHARSSGGSTRSTGCSGSA